MALLHLLPQGLGMHGTLVLYVPSLFRYKSKFGDNRCCRGALLRSGEGSSAPGAPKKADDHCFIDLHTTRRTYSLCAETRQQALDWMEKIQNCL